MLASWRAIDDALSPARDCARAKSRTSIAPAGIIGCPRNVRNALQARISAAKARFVLAAAPYHQASNRS